MEQNSIPLAATGEAYEPLTGRWSRLVAPRFLEWIDAGSNGRWLDVGCGTGALIQAILDAHAPKEVVGVDPSSAYIAYARREIGDPRVRYEVGDARSLPVASNQYDAVVSGLVLDVLGGAGQIAAIREMMRTARRGGVVASYIWDYSGGREPRAQFWNTATELDPDATIHTERARYPLARPGRLARLLHDAGLHAVETTEIEIDARFQNFDDYWQPFLAGEGAASDYLLSLSDDRRSRLQTVLRDLLLPDGDGSFSLPIRALCVRSVK